MIVTDWIREQTISAGYLEYYARGQRGHKGQLLDRTTAGYAVILSEARLTRGEFEDDRLAVLRTGLEHCRRKFRLVRRVREMLRFEAERGSMRIHRSAFTLCPVQEVPAVELHAGLRRPQLHHTT